ncbi:hypothetical protein ACFWR9_41805 [Streptomyces sp. NPDC058534]|uniref:hypothetical protein n=1 Tax=Streptomyces sp. NPDC058534 TaxID=3346541 RepID=UPI0036585D65
MSDSILVRVTLDAYDVARPLQKQTQVYVQIPEVARVSWLLDVDLFQGLKLCPWPGVVDAALADYDAGQVITDTDSANAREAVRAWLRDDANRDEMQAAWEQDHARRHPVARKLLDRVAELEARLAEFERPTDEDPIAYTLAEQGDGSTYPLALPWAALMDRGDLAEFLLDLGHATCDRVDALEALAEVESTCGTWRLIAEAQHAHNTAPGPQAEADGITRKLVPVQVLRAEADDAQESVHGKVQAVLLAHYGESPRPDLIVGTLLANLRAEMLAEPHTVYRPEHDSIVMGLYTTAAAARAHCQGEERRTWAAFEKPAFDWIEDEEDGFAEMTVTVNGEEIETGYVVTALEIASEYDAEADE